MGPGGKRGAYNRWGVADSLGRADGLAISVISSLERLSFWGDRPCDQGDGGFREYLMPVARFPGTSVLGDWVNTANPLTP